MNTRKSIINSPRLRAKKRKRFFIFLVIILLIAIIVLGGAFYILKREFFKIQGVSVLGVKVIDETEVKAEVENILKETRFGIPFNTFFTYPKGRIETKIKELFSVTKSIYLEIEDKNLLITIVEKKPEALWCRVKCFFVDDTGVVYKETPILEGDVYVSFVDNQKSDLSLGMHVIEESVLGKVLTERNKLQKEKFSIWSILIVSNDEFHLKDNSGMYIKVSPLEDLSSQVERVRVALTSKELSSKSFNSIEYIDARFGAKLFLKDKTESVSTEEVKGL